MPITGNKGEWSEIYALFKLLGDGEVCAGDANMQKINNLIYPIIKIIREEQNRNIYEYSPDKLGTSLVTIEENGVEILQMPMTDFLAQAQQLLSDIRNGSGAAFSIPNTETFMNSVMCHSIKARSQDKADIHIVIHDFRTGMMPLQGFSIKSKLGSPSTLLNAGIPTNFTYKVDQPVSNADLVAINAVADQKPRMNLLFGKGYSISYHCMDNSTFEDNLLVVDSRMPEIVAEIMKEYFISGFTSLKDLTNQIVLRNPYRVRNPQVYYTTKVKSLLVDSALGMTPATPWTRQYDANGGYLVVRVDGEVICYHFYDRNQFEDYLFNDTKIDWPSRHRYGWGSLYQNGNDTFIKLNLQIRFK